MHVLVYVPLYLHGYLPASFQYVLTLTPCVKLLVCKGRHAFSQGRGTALRYVSVVFLSSSIQMPKYYTKLGCHRLLSSSLLIRRYVVWATENGTKQTRSKHIFWSSAQDFLFARTPVQISHRKSTILMRGFMVTLNSFEAVESIVIKTKKKTV